MSPRINNYLESSGAYKLVVVFVLFALIFFGAFLFIKLGYSPLFAAAIIPSAILLGLFFSRAPKTCAACVFAFSFLGIGLGRYIPGFKMGIAFDGCILVFLFVIAFNTLFSKVEWKKGSNIGSFLSLIWLIYCFLELFNPHSVSSEAWLTAVRWEAFYFFVVIFFTPIIISNVRVLKKFCYLLSFLTILAIIWILKQKYIGLNAAEYRWLLDPVIRNTHILPFGIRYWSFFIDAANAAVTFGLCASFFGIVALFSRKGKERNYFFIISFLALWASLFTGTRSHLVIPFVSLIVLIICAKNSKFSLLAIFFLVCVFVFFRYTNIGNSNIYIWRARSAFHFEEDASYQLRVVNHAKIKQYMSDKPFGIGIGLAEWKGLKYNSNSKIASIMTDSWIYTLFVETGIVGVLLYLVVFLSMLAYGVWIVLFKLKTQYIRGVAIASIGGAAGVLLASYGNEVLAQFPNGIIVFIFLGIIFSCPDLDVQYQDYLASCNNKDLLSDGNAKR